MRSRLLAFTAAAAMVVGAAPSAEAAGCIKGAIAGGVAGHYAGGHTVLGAVGGCVVGRHLANSQAAKQREEQLQRQQQNPVTYDGTVSPDPAHKRLPSDARYSGTTVQPTQPSAVDATGAPLYTGGAYQR